MTERSEREREREREKGEGRVSSDGEANGGSSVLKKGALGDCQCEEFGFDQVM